MLVKRVIDFFTSLRLTVVCLCVGLVLVFVGTLAQVDLGLYKAQNEFFRAFFVYWSPAGASWKIPVLPGGYLLGTVLLLNLIAAHIKRFKLTKKKIGIFMIHAGLILLLLGQLLTDSLSVESSMHLRNGEKRNYSESQRRNELAIVDKTDPDTDMVVAIPESLLVPGQELHHAALPFTIQVKKYFANSSLTNAPAPGFEKPEATQGVGPMVWMREEPRVTSTDFRDVPTAVIEVDSPQGAVGNWLVSADLNTQDFTLGNRSYEIALRPQREYRPYSLQLIKFNHARYKGTDIPKDFTSLVRLEHPETKEDREVRIYMNNPLRYQGETFYQQSFDQDDQGTVLEVVRNPSWLTPYISCALIGLGMVVQFGMHLVGFAKKRAHA